ncbi:ChaN family lipoprotein [Cribrihabitans pelagius]|uniref:ChaN family lipoprotein n=1 Tax=Cribrihabitans pelagius TaxID=1765746 RepID=UPI003B5C8739
MTAPLQALKALTGAAVLAALVAFGPAASGVVAEEAAGTAEAADLKQAAARLSAADAVLLGEVHDNPQHHLNQAALLRALRPRAVVWEMLSPAQAAGLTPDLIQDAAALARRLDWAASGWPDFALYAPVFAAAGDARHYGALLPRTAARAALERGAAGYFGPEDAAGLGLLAALPPAEQAAREAEQMAAHCGALPAEMLPGMVEIQRLRDARLASEAARALAETGGPVAVITGNGHARSDRGIAVYLARLNPGATVLSLGQSEAGRLDGRFDVVLDAPAAPRSDPCTAFR